MDTAVTRTLRYCGDFVATDTTLLQVLRRYRHYVSGYNAQRS